MTNRNHNNKERRENKSIKNQLNSNSSQTADIKNIPFLYGMTLEEYKEGAAIHSRCFDQMLLLTADS